MKTYKDLFNDYEGLLKEDGRINVIYVRESTKKQADDGQNIYAQEEKCNKYLDYKDSDTKRKVFREKGVSAKTTERKELKKVKQLIMQGKVKKLVVYKLDRLVRRLKGLSEMMELMQRYNVQFVSVKEDFDTSTTIGRMMINFVTMLAEWEQDTISERTVEALKYAAKEGSYIIGNKPPFGYARQVIYREFANNIITLVAIPQEIEIVKQMFAWSDEGYNDSQIAAKANALPYMQKYGIVFSEKRVGTILSNKIYCGIMVIKKQEFKVKVDVIMTQEKWHQVQRNRSIHLKSDIKNEYPYKGLVYCKCGAKCTVDVTNKRNRQGVLTKYYYYECPVCGKRINQNEIVKQVTPALQRRFTDKTVMDIQTKLNKRLNKAEELKTTLYKMYINDNISSDIYMEQIKHVHNEIKYATDHIHRSVQSFDDLKDNEINQLMHDMVSKVQVDMRAKRVHIKYQS